MTRSIMIEGHTTSEAIEKGLKILKTTKDKVDIKIIEEEKRSFFSILEPRIVKVEMTLREPEKEEKEEYITTQEMQNIQPKLELFIKEVFGKMQIEDLQYKIYADKQYVNVLVEGKNINYLIGYKGEVLNALQTVISAYASHITEHKIKVVFDLNHYKEKRKVILEDLAERMANKAVKTRKNVTLEPMQPYERKIIHAKLQNHPKVRTHSIGENQNRRIVIELKK